MWGITVVLTANAHGHEHMFTLLVINKMQITNAVSSHYMAPKQSRFMTEKTSTTEAPHCTHLKLHQEKQTYDFHLTMSHVSSLQLKLTTVKVFHTKKVVHRSLCL